MGEALDVTVRPGEAGDVAPASAVLAAAFESYPWIELTVAPDRRAERLRDLYAVILGDLVVPHGRLWVAEDGSGRVVGAAGWLTAASDPPSELLIAVDDRVRELRGVRAVEADAAEATVRAATTRSWQSERAWTLGALGVRPSVQGTGVGAALLTSALAVVDEGRAAAHLETSLERNVSLYQRFGFTVTSHLFLPGGVPCWLMRRAPSPPVRE
jgi:GNAT superfamily N-acetyltransferase